MVFGPPLNPPPNYFSTEINTPSEIFFGGKKPLVGFAFIEYNRLND